MAQSISLTEANVHALATDQSFDRCYRTLATHQRKYKFVPMLQNIHA